MNRDAEIRQQIILAERAIKDLRDAKSVLGRMCKLGEQGYAPVAALPETYRIYYMPPNAGFVGMGDYYGYILDAQESIPPLVQEIDIHAIRTEMADYCATMMCRVVDLDPETGIAPREQAGRDIMGM